MSVEVLYWRKDEKKGVTRMEQKRPLLKEKRGALSSTVTSRILGDDAAILKRERREESLVILMKGKEKDIIPSIQ